MRLRPPTLQENLASRLTRETQRLFRTRLLTAAMFGAMLSPIFGIVDITASRSWQPDLPVAGFLVLRAGITLWFAALWVWLRQATNIPVKAMDWLLFAPPAVALGYMTAATGGAASPYVAGTTLLVTARTILVPGAAKSHIGVVGFLVASYPLTLLAFAPKDDGFAAWFLDANVLGHFCANFFPLVAIAGVGLVASDMIHAMHQRLVSARSLGRYKIKKELGRGAMGVVYLAWHRDLGRPCVIKLVNPDRTDSRALRRRFEREARETSMLSSPYTVDVFDFGITQEGQLFYVMEYLAGISLQDVLDSSGAQLHDVVTRWMTYVCEALAEAHHRGLIHRDLKPANLFLSRTGDGRQVVKVLDFGIARKALPSDADEDRPRKRRRSTRLPEAADLTAVGTVMGTPLYVAPEVLQGEPAGPASDQYSLAATAFHLLTGRPVFTGASIEELLYKTVTVQAPRPSSIVPQAGISRGLDAVILRALEKDPRERYASMEVFRQALEPFAGAPGAASISDIEGPIPTATSRRSKKKKSGADSQRTMPFGPRVSDPEGVATDTDLGVISDPDQGSS
jgi:serine/threonine-protein kinase